MADKQLFTILIEADPDGGPPWTMEEIQEECEVGLPFRIVEIHPADMVSARES